MWMNIVLGPWSSCLGMGLGAVIYIVEPCCV